MTVPTLLIAALKRHVPDFDREENQYAIARMLLDTLDSRRKHKHYPHAFWFNRQYIRDVFGTDEKFRKVNRDPLCRYFKVYRSQNGGPKNKNYTNGYEPQPWMQDALGEFLLSEERGDLLNKQGKIVRSAPAAINSLDRDGNPVIGWKRDDAPDKVYVDLQNLKKFEEFHLLLLAASIYGRRPKEMQYQGDEKTKALVKQTAHIRKKATTRNFYGAVLHRYTQSIAGRLFAEGVNLQSCSKQIRNAALRGHWDYDINCCHFAILRQMAARVGCSCPSIDHYVQNKNIVRQAVADESGITPKQAKSVLTMTAYGAPASVREDDAIPSEIGVDAARRVYASPTFQAIKKEALAASRKILNKHKDQNGNFVNAFNKALKKSKIKRSEKMSHLLTGIEAMALRAAVRTCRDSVVLLQHDGFVTNKRIDLNAVHQAVRDETGYELTFECDEIVSALPDITGQRWAEDLKVEIARNPSIHAGLRRVLGGGRVTIADNAEGEQGRVALPEGTVLPEGMVLPERVIPPVFPDPIPDAMFPLPF